jgi:hypothetical protein
LQWQCCRVMTNRMCHMGDAAFAWSPRGPISTGTASRETAMIRRPKKLVWSNSCMRQQQPWHGQIQKSPETVFDVSQAALFSIFWKFGFHLESTNYQPSTTNPELRTDGRARTRIPFNQENGKQQQHHHHHHHHQLPFSYTHNIIIIISSYKNWVQDHHAKSKRLKARD